MGTISYRSSKAEAIRGELEMRSDFIVKSQVIGSSIWYIGNCEGQKFIGLIRIESEGGEVFVKEFDESMGPFYFNCPLSFLAEASDPVGYAIEWRKKVLRLAADAKAKRALIKPGCKVSYGGKIYRLVKSLGAKGWMVNCGGFDCRMKSNQLRAAKVVA